MPTVVIARARIQGNEYRNERDISYSKIVI